MKVDFIKSLLSKSSAPVAVFGNGISGRAVKDLLEKKGYAFDIFDQKDKMFCRKNARNCSLVITSPGFPPSHEWIMLAEEEGKKIITELDLGVCYAMARSLAGITGTNGKTSLSTILSYVANKLGLPSIALGNIGYPLSSAVANGGTNGKIIFLETSSFQATQSSSLFTDSLLWTNFAPDHLDYHKSEKEYFLAKLKLANACKEASNVWVGESVISSAKSLKIPLNPNFKVVRSLTEQEVPHNLNSCLKSIDVQTKVLIIDHSNDLKKDQIIIPKNIFLEILKNKNLGNGAGINYGIKYAKTKYVLYLDIDTILPKNFFD